MVRETSEIIWLPRGLEFLSGLPERKRKGRKIVAFQAFIDDSGTKGTGKILMLGGLFGSAEAMASLADRWDMELRSHVPLPIRYFKADEARSLSGEFQCWQADRRDEKVRRLAAVIDRDDLLMVYSGADLGAHKQLEQQVGTGVDARQHPYNHPYLLSLLTVMLAVGMEMQHRQSDERVEVIFDDQPKLRQYAKDQYALLRQTAPAWLLKRLPLEPFFRDDMDFVVLQAADLLMGNARMHVEKTPNWPTLDWQKLMASPFSKYYAAREISELAVKHLARTFGVPESAFKVTIERPVDETE